MPIYEFLCRSCGHEFGVLLSLTEYEKEYEEHKAVCPKCGSQSVEQVVGACSVMTSRKS